MQLISLDFNIIIALKQLLIRSYLVVMGRALKIQIPARLGLWKSGLGQAWARALDRPSNLLNNMLIFSGPFPKDGLGSTLGLGPSSEVELRSFQKSNCFGPNPSVLNWLQNAMCECNLLWRDGNKMNLLCIPKYVNTKYQLLSTNCSLTMNH